MNTSRSRWVAWSCIAALTISLLAWVAVRPTAAALGNSGVPVECHGPGYVAISPDTTVFLDCVAADGTAFDSGQRVPGGHYLLVTDLVVTYYSGGVVGDTHADLAFYDAFDESSRAASLWLRNPVKGTLGEHFVTPYLVLPGGHRLEVVNPTHSDHLVYVAVSGLLVTNLSYLPLINR